MVRLLSPTCIQYATNKVNKFCCLASGCLIDSGVEGEEEPSMRPEVWPRWERTAYRPGLQSPRPLLGDRVHLRFTELFNIEMFSHFFLIHMNLCYLSTLIH